MNTNLGTKKEAADNKQVVCLDAWCMLAESFAEILKFHARPNAKPPPLCCHLLNSTFGFSI